MIGARSHARVEVHPRITVRHLPFHLVGDARRSILLPFGIGGHHDLKSVFTYVKSLSDEEVAEALGSLIEDFAERHEDFEKMLEERSATAAAIDGSADSLSRDRRLLLGAYFSMEYSIEAAALFNPSIVAHPDQRGAPPGGCGSS